MIWNETDRYAQNVAVDTPQAEDWQAESNNGDSGTYKSQARPGSHEPSQDRGDRFHESVTRGMGLQLRQIPGEFFLQGNQNIQLVYHCSVHAASAIARYLELLVSACSCDRYLELPWPFSHMSSPASPPPHLPWPLSPHKTHFSIPSHPVMLPTDVYMAGVIDIKAWCPESRPVSATTPTQRIMEPMMDMSRLQRLCCRASYICWWIILNGLEKSNEINQNQPGHSAWITGRWKQC